MYWPRPVSWTRGCECALVQFPLGGREQLDQVARRVGEQDLTTARAGDDIAAERESGVAQPGDLGVQVIDHEVDPVAAGDVVGGGAGAGAGQAGQQEA